MTTLRHPASRTQPAAGFTLVEAMTVVAIVAILVTLAIPSYADALRRGRRTDAISALTAIQLAQERRRANAPAYTTELAQLMLGARSLGGHYLLTIDEASGTGYTATAAAAADSPQARDAVCRTLRIRVRDGGVSYGSACSTCTVTEPLTDLHRCWSRS